MQTQCRFFSISSITFLFSNRNTSLYRFLLKFFNFGIYTSLPFLVSIRLVHPDYSWDWEHETRKPRVLCFVYINTTTRTPSRNMKQTWMKQTIFIHVSFVYEKRQNTKETWKIGKFTSTPRSFKYYPSPLRFPL